MLVLMLGHACIERGVGRCVCVCVLGVGSGWDGDWGVDGICVDGM